MEQMLLIQYWNGVIAFFYEVIRFTPQGPQTLVDIQNMEK